MQPLISIILPTYNEGAHIEATLRSLLTQKRDGFDFEILVVDGRSSDNTVDVVTKFLTDSRMKLLNNPAQTAPAAFNLGLRAAAGEYVCILGAHANYDSDYVATCYQELLAHNAEGCSGRIITVSAEPNASARLAAWCLGHAFGSSPNSVRTQREGFADTIPYPLFRKSVLLNIGGYNEQLVRNQDNDMNSRLLRAGCRLYLTGKTTARYVARSTVTSLLAYARSSGRWNALTLRINPGCMRLRHFIPFAFVVLLAVLTCAATVSCFAPHRASLAVVLLATVVVAHLLFGTAAGICCCLKDRRSEALLLPFVIFAFHVAYGFGTLEGLLQFFEKPAAATAARATSSV